MFAKATRNFLKDIDSGGDLISVSSLNDSDKAQLLSVVAKKRRFWYWQKPKYHFSSFACMLSDVLIGEAPVKPVVVESEFVKYEGTFGDVIQGNLGADVGTFHMTAAGSGSAECQSSFGTLRKQEVDMQHLMKDVQERRINMCHPFIQQLKNYKKDVLCILKEKIVTTQKCVITEHAQMEETFSGKLGMKSKIVKVSVSENGNYIKNENTVLEIPPPTAIAYAVVELDIKHDGRFELCLLSEKKGGFEKENSERHHHNTSPYDEHSLYHLDVVDGIRDVLVERKMIPCNVSIKFLKQDLLELTKHFSVWEQLPEVQCLELYKLLCEILYDGDMITWLQTLVEGLCLKSKPSLTACDDLKPSQRKIAENILHLIGCDLQNEKLVPLENRDLLMALYILTSALDEMSDSALAVLGMCCDLQLLPVLCALPNITSDEGLCSRTDPFLSTFIDQGRFQTAQRLFALSNLKLEMNEHSIKATTSKEPGFLPFILYISMTGLQTLRNLKI
ncbi:gasdermin-E [Rhinophrynus dorsalis]